MRRSHVVIFLTTLCLSTQIVFAQSNSDLATNIDRNAAAVGLPAGDGANSPAEVYLASLMRQEMDDFSGKVDTFEQSSPQNSELINQVEDTTGQYNELAHVSHDDAMAQTLGEVSKNLEALINKLEAEAANDPNAQAIADGVADADAGDPLTPEESSAYAKEISEAFNQYNRENAQALGKDTLAPTEQNFMVQSVINAINDYLNDSNVKRKEIVKRRMKRLIEIMVPSQNLPINGYWRPLPYSVSTSGSCIATNGDNDGPGSSGANNENPGNPLCGYAIAGAPPFITWTDGSHPYLPGSSSMYGRAPQETFSTITNGSGQTTGSVKITTMTEYEVISPTQIRVHVFRQEAGGCTQNSTYMLELVTPDDSVCNVPVAAATPEPISTPVPTIPKSTYIIREPSLSEPAECDATNTPPQAEEITLEQASDYSVTIEFGGVTKTLFPSGNDYYDYYSGREGNLRESISLSVSDDRTSGYLTWSINNIDTGNLCYYSSNIALPGSVSEEPASGGSSSAGEDTGSSSGSGEDVSFTLEAGDVDVSLNAMPGLTCPGALLPQIPVFENTTLTSSGTGFTLESDGVEYPLMSFAEQYMYTTINPDNSVVYMGIFSRENDGSMTGLYSYSLENGTNCVFQMEFAPAG